MSYVCLFVKGWKQNPMFSFLLIWKFGMLTSPYIMNTSWVTRRCSGKVCSPRHSIIEIPPPHCPLLPVHPPCELGISLYVDWNLYLFIYLFTFLINIFCCFLSLQIFSFSTQLFTMITPKIQHWTIVWKGIPWAITNTIQSCAPKVYTRYIILWAVNTC